MTTATARTPIMNEYLDPVPDASTSIYICIKQFNARLGDELNLKVGDKIEVLADDHEYNDGWYMGKNLSSDDVGLYPKTFTQLIASNSHAPMLRSRSRRLNSQSNSPYSPGASNNAANSVPSLVPTDQMKTSTPNTTMDTISNTTNPQSSVHRTMSDIDKALQELRGDTLSILDEENNRNSNLSNLDALSPTNAKNWTPEQVSSYFSYLGFDVESAGQFARHKITGAILLELELAYLKELDITSFGTRFEMFKEIESLKTAAEEGPNIASLKKTELQQKQKPSKLMPAVALQKEKPTSKYYKHQRKKSQSMDDLTEQMHNVSPLQNKKSVRTPKMRQTSGSNMAADIESGDNSKSSSQRDKRHSSFLSSPAISPPIIAGNFPSFDSPRKAPEPPSYESPIRNSYKFGGENTLNLNKSRPASSIYYESSINSHRRHTSDLSMADKTHHRRHSSVFSFLSNNANGNGNIDLKKSPATPSKITKTNVYGTPSRIPDVNKEDLFESTSGLADDEETAASSPTRRSVSVKNTTERPAGMEKRSTSDTFKFKAIRTASSQNLKSLAGRGKVKTSAFQEGIREVTPDDAIKSASYSGWMSKRGNASISTWKQRFFTLHGTRLSYFTSLKDKRERGLIDITAHKVLAAREGEDKFAAIYAASTGSGRYCFKLVPPAPGYRKGLTFTQPKTHYFAVETQEEMRGWMAALMKATIEMDDSVPILSSCTAPTVTLGKAQEMLAKAREETRIKDEELRLKGYIRPGDSNSQHGNESTDYSKMEGSGSSSLSPEESSITSNQSPHLKINTNVASNTNNNRSSHHTNRTSKSTALTTPIVGMGDGFSSPYLLASGFLSPKSPRSPDFEYFDQSLSSVTHITPAENESASSILLKKKSSVSEKKNDSRKGSDSDLSKRDSSKMESLIRKSSLGFLSRNK